MAGGWTDINRRVREVLAGPDPVGGLTRLFEETDDGNVALQAGRHLLRVGRPCEAIEWFERAEDLLLLENFKRQAATGRARALRACGERPSWPAESPAGTLHVVCCTKRKIWQDDPTADRSVPAGRAYTGRTFDLWHGSQEAAEGAPWVVLSAKYGFLDPDHLIEDYDVTFSEPSTHPVDDARLRAQAASMWPAFGRPLTAFESVRVLGSATYVDRVRAAFAGTGVDVSRWKPGGDATAPDPSPARPTTSFPADLGVALGALPDAVFARADEMLPEWPVLDSFAALRFGLGALAALGVALNNYNLGRGGADAYWAAAQRIVGDAGISNDRDLRRCLELLLAEPVAAPNAVDRRRKEARLGRLFDSTVPRLLARGVRRIDVERLWQELAAAPGPSADAKTVVYAMRTYALLHRRATGEAPALPARMPLPVDVRIVRLALASGLIDPSRDGVVDAMERDARRIASDRRDEVATAWNGVAAAGGRPAMALDSLLWLAAKRVHDERRDRAHAAYGVRELLIEMGAERSEADAASIALTAALPGRPDPHPVPARTRPAFDLNRAHATVEAVFGDAVVSRWETPSVAATYDAALRDDTDAIGPAVRAALFDRVLTDGDLYVHQARAIRAALDGDDVVVETATASGKTLCYQVPILDALSRDPAATALYLAPINALVEDQMGAVTRFGDTSSVPGVPDEIAVRLTLGNAEVTVARYDGGVPSGPIRSAVRRAAPRLLITNPDMLSHGLLPHHDLWARFFANLRCVVLDEMHTYRGLFGAHVANLLRRLWRITGTCPQVIGCSASIGNPEELFHHLVGRHPGTVIRDSDSGAPRHRRRTMVVDTTRIGGGGDRMAAAAAGLVTDLVERGDAPTITFMRSIREVDVVHERAVRDLSVSCGHADASRWVRPYKREMPVELKAQVIRDLRDGAARAVVATTALQMGIDVGALSVAVVGGFPGRVAALNQSTGRAGRSGEGLAVVLLGDSALDQHYAVRPDELTNPPEHVFVHPDNEEIVRRHVLAAADEKPLGVDDHEAFGPSTFDLVEELRSSGDLVSTPEGFLVPSTRHRGSASALDIRTTTGFDCVVTTRDGTVVARPDAARRCAATTRRPVSSSTARRSWPSGSRSIGTPGRGTVLRDDSSGSTRRPDPRSS